MLNTEEIKPIVLSTVVLGLQSVSRLVGWLVGQSVRTFSYFMKLNRNLMEGFEVMQPEDILGFFNITILTELLTNAAKLPCKKSDVNF